jgi:hypothetical protein
MQSESKSVLHGTDSRMTVQSEDVLHHWHLLSEGDKVRLIPHLLANMEDWRSATRNERFLIGWLRRMFAKAGLSLWDSATG